MRLRLLGLLVLAVTAGCGSLTGSDAETTTVTPAPVPTTSSTFADSRSGVVPGLDATGVTDSGALAGSHLEAASETSYVWRRSKFGVHQFGNSTVNTSVSWDLTVEDTTVYHRKIDPYETVVEGRVAILDDYEEYSDGDAVYRTWRTDDGRTVRANVSAGGVPNHSNSAAQMIRRYLDLESQRVSRIDTGDGTYYVVVETRSSLPRFGPLYSYRARAVVRADGFVRSLDVRFETRRSGDRITVRDDFTYRQVGSATVTEPN